MKRFSPFALLVLVIAIALLYYGRFQGNFFAEDDFKYLENIITGPRAIALGYNAQLRLVSNFAWLPVYFISGLNPHGYNAVSLAIAVANALLLYPFLTKLLDRRDVAFLAALIFMASAAGADAILWKMSISTLLSLFFNLLALNLYLSYRRQGSRQFYVAAVAVFVLAMFSKDDAVALVGIIIVMELLFFQGWDHRMLLIKRVAPFAAVVLFFLTVSAVTFHLLGLQSETWGAFQFKPLYSLLGGGSAFFIGPVGLLKMSDPRIYLTVAMVPLLFVFVQEKRMLAFGYLWIFLTFIPSSLTSIAKFIPAYFPNCISRFLYAPSLGVSLVMAIALVTLKDRFGKATFSGAAVLFLLLLVGINQGRVHEKGALWQKAGASNERFITDLKEMLPQLPDNSTVAIWQPPTSTGFTQQMLRAFYGTPWIYTTKDPVNFDFAVNGPLFIVFCDSRTKRPFLARQVHSKRDLLLWTKILEE